MSLTALFVWRNVCTSYVPLESFLSVKDALDEAIICFDPTSTDETVELAYAIADKWPIARTIEHVWQTPSVMGSAIGEASNFALKFVNTDLVVNIQADECWYPELVEAIKGWEKNVSCSLLSLSFLHTRYNAQELQANAGYRAAYKLAQMQGHPYFENDAWQFNSLWGGPMHLAISEQYPVVHLHHFFRGGIIKQLENNVWLFGDDNSIREHEAMAGDKSFLSDPLWGKTDSPFMLPELIRPHLGQMTYRVNWNIFK